MKAEKEKFLVVLLLLCPVAFLTEYALSGLLLGIGAAILLPLCHLITAYLPFDKKYSCWIAFAATGILVSLYMLLLEKYYPVGYYKLEGGLACVTVAVYYIVWQRTAERTEKDIVSALLEGASYLGLVTMFSALRELLAYGSLFGIQVCSENLEFFARPEAAFFLLAIMMALAKELLRRLGRKAV